MGMNNTIDAGLLRQNAFLAGGEGSGGRTRNGFNELNVFPVPDGDTW